MKCDWHVGDALCVWCQRPMEAHRWASCPDCDGHGYVEGWEDDITMCPTCENSKVMPSAEVAARRRNTA